MPNSFRFFVTSFILHPNFRVVKAGRKKFRITSRYTLWGLAGPGGRGAGSRPLCRQRKQAGDARLPYRALRQPLERPAWTCLLGVSYHRGKRSLLAGNTAGGTLLPSHFLGRFPKARLNAPMSVSVPGPPGCSSSALTSSSKGRRATCSG